MIKEYITVHNNEFNCTKYTLSTGKEIILSLEEEKELLDLSETYLDKVIEIDEYKDSTEKEIADLESEIDDLKDELYEAQKAF